MKGIDVSSWASIEIGGMSISETQNYYHKWFFRKSERTHKVIENVPLEGEEEQAERKIFCFEASVGTIKQRLELNGFDREALEADFQEQLKLVIDDLASAIELSNQNYENFYRVNIERLSEQADWIRFHKAVSQSKIGDWLLRLEKIWKEKIQSRYTFGKSNVARTGDDLMDFMMGGHQLWRQYPTAGGYQFPCLSEESYAVALMQFMPETELCRLDVSDLVAGGWINDFDDLVEHQSENTYFYEVFLLALEEIHELKILLPENETLARLLYASVITAMESYLSDTLKKQILNRESIRRRFLRYHDVFKAKIAITDIYEKMESLKHEMIEEIDKMSFHNIERVIPMFKSVLATEFPIIYISELKEALGNRHDIVHRNGKRIDGTLLDIKISDVNKLIDIVDRTISSIDLQIKDRLLDDVDE